MPDAPGAVDVAETSPPQRRRRAVVVLGVGLTAAGWLIVAVLGLVALLRLVAWDSFQPLIVLDALTLFVYLPAWTAAAASHQRRAISAPAATIQAGR